MPPETAVPAVGLDDHRHGIPAEVALDAPFDIPVAGILRFLFGRDGVHIGGGHKARDREPLLPEPIGQARR